LYLADLFSLCHGKIQHPKKQSYDIWSIAPINIFRYKLTKDFTYDLLHYPAELYSVDGYIVEGAYWSNGFIYQVRFEDFNKVNYLNEVLEINLYIDIKTKYNYGYSDPELSYQDLINAYCPGSSADRATDF